MAERTSVADPVLSGVLERLTPHNSPVAIDPVGLEPPLADPTDVEPLPAVGGRGASPGEQQVSDSYTARRIRGRTIYLPDDLFERILAGPPVRPDDQRVRRRHPRTPGPRPPDRPRRAGR